MQIIKQYSYYYIRHITFHGFEILLAVQTDVKTMTSKDTNITYKDFTVQYLS